MRYPLDKNLERLLQLMAGKEIQSLSSLDMHTYNFSCASFPKFLLLASRASEDGPLPVGLLVSGAAFGCSQGHTTCIKIASLTKSKCFTGFTNEQHQFLSHCGCKPSFYQSLRLGHKLGRSLSTRGHQRPIALPHSPRGVLQLQPAGYSCIGKTSSFSRLSC